MRKFAFLYLVMLPIFLANVSAEWNIGIQIFPENFSENSTAVLVADIRDSSLRLISPDNCEQYSITYNFSESDILTYRENSTVWIAELNTGAPPAMPVAVNGEGKCYNAFDSGSASKNISYGTLEVKIELEENVIADGFFQVSTNVTKNGTAVQGANVDLFIRDPVTNFETRTPMFYSSPVKAYKALPRAPSNPGKYILYVIARNNNESGGSGKILEVGKGLKGKMILKSAKGSENLCNKDMTACDVGSKIDVLFEETSGKADKVEVRVRNIEELLNFTMERVNSSFWHGNFTIPENFNTTRFGKNLNVVLNAMSNKSNFFTTKFLNVEYLDAKMFFKSRVLPEENVKVLIDIFRPISKKTLLEEDISSIEIQIFSPSNSSVLKLSTENFSYQSGIFTTEFKFSAKDEPGNNKIELLIADNYSRSIRKIEEIILEKTNSGPLLINTTRISENFTSPGKFVREILLNNTGNNSLVVEHRIESAEGDLNEIMKISTDGSEKGKLLFPGEVKTTKVEFDIKEEHKNRNYSGNIIYKILEIIEDGNPRPNFIGNVAIPINVNTEFRTGLEIIPKNITKKEFEKGTFLIPIKIRNLGPENRNLLVHVEGNVSEISDILIENQTPSVPPNSEIEIFYQYTASYEKNGEYSGNVIISESFLGVRARIPVSLIINVTEEIQDFEFEILTKEISVMKGDLAKINYRIKNTGDVPLNIKIEANLPDFNVVGGRYSFSLGVNESMEDSVEIDTSNLGIGKFRRKLLAEAEEGIKKEDSIDINILRDYKSEIEVFRQKVQQYESKAEEFGDRAQNLRLLIKDLKEAVNNADIYLSQKNYTSAEGWLEQAKTLEKKVQKEINNLESVDVEEIPTTPPEEGPENGEEGGGFPVLLIIIILIIVVAIAVVIYLSIVPE